MLVSASTNRRSGKHRLVNKPGQEKHSIKMWVRSRIGTRRGCRGRRSRRSR